MTTYMEEKASGLIDGFIETSHNRLELALMILDDYHDNDSARIAEIEKVRKSLRHMIREDIDFGVLAIG